jgi:hypothetical protein
MVRVLTPQEELASRKKDYQQLETGRLFDLGGKRFFIAVEKSHDAVQVIELNGENIDRILNNDQCIRTKLNFADMKCLNLR